jgi:hypothetical protein
LRSLGLRSRTFDDKRHCPLNGGRDVLGADFVIAQVALAHEVLLPHLDSCVWTTAEASWGRFAMLH